MVEALDRCDLAIAREFGRKKRPENRWWMWQGVGKEIILTTNPGPGSSKNKVGKSEKA